MREEKKPAAELVRLGPASSSPLPSSRRRRRGEMEGSCSMDLGEEREGSVRRGEGEAEEEAG